MRYRDLVQFDPIESVVQLHDANRESDAERLVSTYVISETMADRLVHIVFPQLQFQDPVDNKGLLIVGNYGTGKSHLMSVISAVAEHAALADKLRNAAARAAAAPIAGRFQVLRLEIGTTEMSLREAVVSRLAIFLDHIGVQFVFPSAAEVINFKQVFEDMMVAFQARYPDQGLLVVVDELLDYLRTRRDQELVRDLIILREMGEVARHSRFRFMAGVQEMLFENSRFSFAADSVRRVQDRFEQVFIARDDVKFVVAERLLHKTADQQVWARQHLSRFTRFYGSMNEQLDEFVRLFPVHPLFIDTFERVTAIEKREVLKTLSRAMEQRLDDDVPPDEPGLITYDRYWKTLRENPSYRAIPDIGLVIKRSETLENRVETAFPHKTYVAMARRIIHGLSMHRLTHGDILAPIGATPEELRDGLALYDPLIAELGGDPADDLLTQVETVLRDIHRTVSGQFISVNPANRQYYLDLEKSDDYDAIIDKRAESLEPGKLDSYYYDALHRALENPEQTLYPGYKIWRYEVEWTDRRAARQGYLFFGSPNERSTAVPPRDFYLYFIQPFEPPRYRDEKKPDEVLFRLRKPDDSFQSALRRYAAAMELAGVASGAAKSAYLSRGDSAHRQLVRWLQENMPTAYEVTHEGQTRALVEWIKGRAATAGQAANVRDMIRAAASACLAGHFADQAPDYPRFSVLITAANLPQAAQDALRYLVKPSRSQQALAVLDALELLEDGAPAVAHSRYAQAVLARLRAKGPDQVLNRTELLAEVYSVEYFAPDRYRLEPELLVVVLAALVHAGELTLTVMGQTFDANNLDGLAATPVDNLAQFRHVRAPLGWNLPGLERLFRLLGLPEGQARLATQGSDAAVQALQTAVGQMVERVVLAQQRLQSGLAFWGKPLLTEAEAADFRARLDELKRFLEGLQAYSSPGRLKNFQSTGAAVNGYAPHVAALGAAEALAALAAELAGPSAALSNAELVLPAGDPWLIEAQRVRDALQAQLSDPAQRAAPATRQDAARQLQSLRAAYAQAYMARHAHARLERAGDTRKGELLQGPALRQLNRLASIALMPGEQLRDFQNRLAELTGCWQLTPADLQTATLCPHCAYRPGPGDPDRSAANRLAALEVELDTLLATWRQTLRDNLADPTAAAAIDLLRPDERARLAALLADDELADLDNDLLGTVNQVLSGLTRVEMSLEALAGALSEGGLPASPEELRKRFDTFLKALSAGQEADKVRLVLVRP